MLVETGAKILTAINGAEAIKCYKNNTVDLIFMDVFMPVLDGFEATEIIRKNEEGKSMHTIIVAITANAMIGDREKCIAKGMDDYLSKPFKIEDLYKMVRKYLLHNGKPVVADEISSSADLQESEVVFNKQELLSNTAGDIKFYKELLSNFKKSFPDLLEKLMLSIKDSDYSQIKYFSHTLKGMCRTVQAIELGNIAEKIEIASKNKKDSNEILALYEQMEIAYNRLLPLLDEEEN